MIEAPSVDPVVIRHLEPKRAEPRIRRPSSSASITVYDVPGSQPGHGDRRDTQAEEGERVALVVDDEPLIGYVICELLARDGWRVVAALDAVTALELIDGMTIALLVTDYEMPGMNGLSLAGVLRERDPGLPVIVLSGWPEAADLVSGPRAAFLAKPFATDELMDRVRALAS